MNQQEQEKLIQAGLEAFGLIGYSDKPGYKQFAIKVGLKALSDEQMAQALTDAAKTAGVSGQITRSDMAAVQDAVEEILDIDQPDDELFNLVQEKTSGLLISKPQTAWSSLYADKLPQKTEEVTEEVVSQPVGPLPTLAPVEEEEVLSSYSSQHEKLIEESTQKYLEKHDPHQALIDESTQKYMESKMNLSPKGTDVGYHPEKTPVKDNKTGEFDQLTKDTIEMLRTASKMEQNTEDAIGKIEAIRKDTVSKADKSGGFDQTGSEQTGSDQTGASLSGQTGIQ